MVRPTRPEDIRFWHGDYHYGNLFFDARKRRVLCVDPRGRLDDGTITSFGDRRYDVAKLAAGSSVEPSRRPTPA
jgi:streptomycin 6-kinase